MAGHACVRRGGRKPLRHGKGGAGGSSSAGATASPLAPPLLLAADGTAGVGVLTGIDLLRVVVRLLPSEGGADATLPLPPPLALLPPSTGLVSGELMQGLTKRARDD